MPELWPHAHRTVCITVSVRRGRGEERRGGGSNCDSNSAVVLACESSLEGLTLHVPRGGKKGWQTCMFYTNIVQKFFVCVKVNVWGRVECIFLIVPNHCHVV